MILAILQARVCSTRLPQKVLLPILGKPMLVHQIERALRATLLDQLLVATSLDTSDDAIENLCRASGIECFRGSHADVLDRYYRAAQVFHPEYVVRLTGDCPLIDPQVIDSVVTFCLEGGYDYASNTIEPTYPDGLDTEVFRISCLTKAWHEAELPSDREHVTPFIWRQPDFFRIGSFRGDANLSGLRWTVDEAIDFELVKTIYEALYPTNPFFAMQDIVRYLELHPDISSVNSRIPRNAGYTLSLSNN
ncbi:MAG: glycosyltransferase family protein [Acidobacteria bacterium]|nr:glycosyltransferase family protein [Acidobacteriota bacterium]